MGCFDVLEGCSDPVGNILGPIDLEAPVAHDAHRDLLTRRYTDNDSITAIAASTDRPVGSIRQTLYRIRQQLADCIDRTLRREARQ